MPIKKPMDNSFKVIFDNHDLFAQFLRRFVRLDILKDVRPQDITDLNERHLPLFQENRDSDVITKKFRYPPILPIIFYDGPERWTAARTLAERTDLGDILSRFIPCFEYLLICLRDYPFASLAEEADPLSFVMVMDKIRGSRQGGALLEELPGKYGERLKIPENMRKLLSDVTRTLLNTGTITKEQIEGIIGQFDRGEYTGMFEGIREGYKKEYRRGYRTAKTRYEKRRQRDREQLETQLRQDQERIRQLEEEVRRLRG